MSRSGSRLRSQPGTPPGELRPVDGAHREDLEALMDLVRVSIDLEAPCDYGDGAASEAANRTAFLAHFTDLERPLREWDAAVERVQAAPGALWSWFERAARKRGIREPPFALGALIDRLAILTADRARHGRLGAPHRLSVEHYRDRLREGERVSMYVEGQHVGYLPDESDAAVERRMQTADALIQALFDDAQRSRPAAEVVDARDLLLDLKRPLLDLLAEHASLDVFMVAAGCPVCSAAERQQTS